MSLTVGPGGTSRKKKTDQQLAEEARLQGKPSVGLPTYDEATTAARNSGSLKPLTNPPPQSNMVAVPQSFRALGERIAPSGSPSDLIPSTQGPRHRVSPQEGGTVEAPVRRYGPDANGPVSRGLAGDRADAFISRTQASTSPGGSGTVPVTPMPGETRQPSGTVPVTAMPSSSGSGTASPPSTGEGPTWGQAPGEQGMFDGTWGQQQWWEQAGISREESGVDQPSNPSLTNTTEQNNRDLEQMYRDRGIGETGVNFQTTDSRGKPIYSSSGVYAKEGDPRQGRWQLSADQQAKIDASDNPQQMEADMRKGLNRAAGLGERQLRSKLLKSGYTTEQVDYMMKETEAKNVAQTELNQGRYDKAREVKWGELNAAYGNREMSRREHRQQWADFNRQWGNRGVQAHRGRPKPRPGAGQPIARRGPPSGWNSGQSGINMGTQDDMLDPTDEFGGGQG